MAEKYTYSDSDRKKSTKAKPKRRRVTAQSDSQITRRKALNDALDFRKLF